MELRFLPADTSGQELIFKTYTFQADSEDYVDLDLWELATLAFADDSEVDSENMKSNSDLFFRVDDPA